MSKQRVMCSMLVVIVLLKIRGWKGLTVHPIDQGKDDFKLEVGGGGRGGSFQGENAYKIDLPNHNVFDLSPFSRET